MDVVDIYFPHIIDGSVAAVAVDNKKALVVRVSWLSQGYKDLLQPLKAYFVRRPPFFGYYKVPALK